MTSWSSYVHFVYQITYILITSRICSSPSLTLLTHLYLYPPAHSSHMSQLLIICWFIPSTHLLITSHIHLLSSPLYPLIHHLSIHPLIYSLISSLTHVFIHSFKQFNLHYSFPLIFTHLLNTSLTCSRRSSHVQRPSPPWGMGALHSSLWGVTRPLASRYGGDWCCLGEDNAVITHGGDMFPPPPR